MQPHTYIFGHIRHLTVSFISFIVPLRINYGYRIYGNVYTPIIIGLISVLQRHTYPNCVIFFTFFKCAKEIRCASALGLLLAMIQYK